MKNQQKMPENQDFSEFNFKDPKQTLDSNILDNFNPEKSIKNE